MQMMFSGLGSGGRSLTCDTGLPCPFAAASTSLSLRASNRSITPCMTSWGPSRGMSFTTSVTSTTLSPATTPSLKSSKNASFMCAPENCNETCSRYADNNLAKMRARGHVPVGRLRLIEGEYLIDYRLNAARRYRTAHRLEHLHRADRDALHVGATGKDQSRIEFARRAGQAADHSDLATDADCTERAGKRRGTADLDNVVNATAAGESERSLLPVGRSLVVDAVIGAECLRTCELVVARRRNDHLNDQHGRELEAEDRDATGALQQLAEADIRTPKLALADEVIE